MSVKEQIMREIDNLTNGISNEEYVEVLENIKQELDFRIDTIEGEL